MAVDDLGRALARIAELEGALAESRAAMAELEQAKDWLQTLLENSPDSIVVVTPDGAIRYTNQAAPGNRIEDAIGASSVRYLLPEDASRSLQAFETVLRTGKPEFVEVSTVFGSTFAARIVRLPGNGSSPMVMCIGTEVTEQKRTEKAFRWSEERGRIAAQAARMGLWSWEADEGVVALDAVSAAMLGWPTVATRASLQDCVAAIHPEDRGALATAAQAFSSGGNLQDVEVRRLGAGGATRWLLFSGVRAVRESTGSEVLIGSLFDVTERRRLEEQLRQAQKMEAVGELTAGIAHNFNNLLTAMLPSIQMAIRDPDNAREPLLDAQYAGGRAAELVQELMLFARRGEATKRAKVDVQELVKRTVSMCRATFDRALSIHFVDSKSPLTVDGDGGQLGQVFLNVCLNARDALAAVDHSKNDANHGLRIELDGVPAEPPATSPGWVRIRITDNGAGMSEDVRARVFEPFFTTKEPGRGTGLGLATAYAIVRDHRGQLLCESTIGVGTTFTVLLPVADARTAPA